MKLNNAKDIRQGTRQVEAVYRGDELLWNSRTLPKGWTRCEYLESDGGQYIQDDSLTVDTSAKFSVGIKFMVSDYSRQLYVMGEQKQDRGRFFLFTNTTSSQKRINFRIRVFNSAYGEEGTLIKYKFNVDSSSHTVIVNNQYFDCDGDADKHGYPIAARTYHLLLFGYMLNGEPQTSPSRIYEFSISHGGIANVELIPCLDKSGRPCMFDVVHRKALYNKGTGEFTYSIA